MEWKEIEHGFATRWNFPGCAGAIDGKHVNIKCPTNSASAFYNYKGYFSTIMLALVDSNYCFIYLEVGSAGRESDGGIFSRSALKREIEANTLNMPPNYVIVGDDAFPLKTYLLKPYSRATQLSYEKKIFNYRLSRARRIVENAFGILVSKFRVFEKPISLSPEKVDKLVLSCCALHNWLRKTSSYLPAGLTDSENLVTGEMISGTWREITRDGLRNITNMGSHNYAREAEAVRHKYSQYFVGPGKVPWQNERI